MLRGLGVNRPAKVLRTFWFGVHCRELVIQIAKLEQDLAEPLSEQESMPLGQ
jgi:hypothetical protein